MPQQIFIFLCSKSYFRKVNNQKIIQMKAFRKTNKEFMTRESEISASSIVKSDLYIESKLIFAIKYAIEKAAYYST